MLCCVMFILRYRTCTVYVMLYNMLSYVTLYNMLCYVCYITRYVYVMLCCITCHVM